MDILTSVKGFEWDKGNITKNWEKQKITHVECEEVFFNSPLLLKEDIKHSESENRYYALGKTNTDRLLFVVFTIRNNRIRVISARDMSRKERRQYAQAQRNTKV